MNITNIKSFYNRLSTSEDKSLVNFFLNTRNKIRIIKSIGIAAILVSGALFDKNFFNLKGWADVIVFHPLFMIFAPPIYITGKLIQRSLPEITLFVATMAVGTLAMKYITSLPTRKPEPTFYEKLKNKVFRII